jgi:hypothetical protein
MGNPFIRFSGLGPRSAFNKCATHLKSAKFSAVVSRLSPQPTPKLFPKASTLSSRSLSLACHHRDGIKSLAMLLSDMRNCRLKLFLSLPS